MSSDDHLKADLIRLRSERDLYRQLVHLGEQLDLQQFLSQALEPIVEITGAARGLLELYDGRDPDAQHQWSATVGFPDQQIESVRGDISRGIIGQAVAGGVTIITDAATLDPRFRDRDSVQHGHITEVLCAPIGGCPPLGVLYLQGRALPGPFSEDDRQAAETFAYHLGPIAGRLITRHRARHTEDPTWSARSRLRVDGLVGRSRALARVLDAVASVCALDVTVMLTGPSGTGKSQIARLIHENSPRRSGPFVAVNCGALPEGLVESELFGAFAGAHSTATRRIEGKVAAAEHGTILLDEIADLPANAQAKLLHLLQSKTYFPLGASRPVVADVRVLAATNVDLEAAVAEHRFREDLYYRLQVVPVRMPALAERTEDIDELAEYFCARAVERHKLPDLDISPGALRVLRCMEWPGHVRQLEHRVEAAAIRAASERALQIETSHFALPDAPPVNGTGLTFQEATRRFQADFVRQMMESCGWNVPEAARRLDIARSHLYNLVRAFGLVRIKK